MFNFLPTCLLLQESQKYLHNSKGVYNSSTDINSTLSKGEIIFRYVLLGIVSIITFIVAIAMVIIAMVIGIVFMTLLFRS